MKNNKVHSLLSWITRKDILNREKLEEDLNEVKLRLQQKGYLEARVGPVQISTLKKQTLFGSVQQMYRIEIPVDLGPRYRVGKIKIEGNKNIRTDFLLSLIKLKQGKIYNIKKRNKSVEEIQKIYGSLGYFYCQIIPQEELDPEKKIADLKLTIVENDIVYLGKLDFVGNTFTKDHVLRREWLLREGKRLNINALEDSIRRMKQLGLVSIDKMPEIKPDPKDPQKIDLKVEVKELNRQMVNFNVGYSGYDGWFIALGYSTQNFLGMGESLNVSFQHGTRAKTYQLAFSEPYLFNLPASFGFNVFKTYFRYPLLYTRLGEGFNLSASGRIWRYLSGSMLFSYERIEITDINPDLSWSDPLSYYYYQEGKRRIASISPTIYYSTVDSPIFPSSGTKYLLNYRYSGGFLGGDVYLHKLKAEVVKFIPVFRKNTLGFHLVYQIQQPFGGKELPFYEKYFLGGEQSIRGFDIYTIGPKAPGGFVIGGNKAFYFNFEYSIPVNEQLAFVFFYDVGNAYDLGTNFNLKDVYSSLGFEFKVFIPMLNVPFRLIFAYNPRLINSEDNHFVFRFAVGPSFY